jgi:hypothetical protein
MIRRALEIYLTARQNRREVKSREVNTWLLRRLRLLAVAAPRTGTGVSNPGQRAGILARPNTVESKAHQNLNSTICFSKPLYLERVQINRSERFQRASRPFPRRAHSASLFKRREAAGQRYASRGASRSHDTGKASPADGAIEHIISYDIYK